MKVNKIFIACPISKYLTEEGLNTEFETFIKNIYNFTKKYANSVFLALEREEYGKNKMYGADCTKADFNEIKDTDILIAIPEDSMGVSVEIGWASALGIKTIVFIDKKYKQSELVKSINSIVNGIRVDIDTTNGYIETEEKVKSSIKEYFQKSI